MEAFNEITKARAEYDKAVKDLGKKAVGEVLESFFQKHEDVLAVKWEQYTPYFNDGDSCTFRVNEVSVKIKGHKPDDDDESGDGFTNWFGDSERKARAALIDSMGELDSALQGSKDMLKHVFGDHQQITVKRNGKITAESYDHD